MYLIFILTIIATWLIVRSNQVQARIPACRFQELGNLTWSAETYTVGYFAIALCGIFFRPYGPLMTAWILAYALVCRIRSVGP
jgi:hypothetical protein